MLIEQGICSSLEHHEPGSHVEQLVAPGSWAYEPGAQLSQVALSFLSANVPTRQRSGSCDPMLEKKPGGVLSHSKRSDKSVRLVKKPAGHGNGAEDPEGQKCPRLHA